MLNLSDKVKTLEVLKGSLSLVEVVHPYGKSKSSLCSTALSSVCTEHAQVFLHGRLLATTFL
jgi:hypothetical protein